MKTKVYVDGQHGTTGLEVNSYLAKHPDIDLITIDYDDRHNAEKRKACLNNADLVILCLPNEGSIEAVSMITNDHTKVIDASTEFRVNDDWIYGLPEMEKGQREKIITAKRVANPGCHATASVLLLRPLTYGNYLNADYPVSIVSITGYSGGGKRLIHQYEVEQEDYLKIPRPYGLTMAHKHIPEIVKHSHLNRNPLFTPIVGNFFRGLTATFTINMSDLIGLNKLNEVVEYYKDYYKDEPFVTVTSHENEDNIIKYCYNIAGSNHTNRADISILGNDEQLQLICRVDNLGKGAGGAAIQNMNLMIGSKEDTTLVL
jgi:N-acetyl-gamma-glutamyl-phosphate reductase